MVDSRLNRDCIIEKVVTCGIQQITQNRLIMSSDEEASYDDADDALDDDDDDAYDAAIDDAPTAVGHAPQPHILIEDALADNRLELMSPEVFLRMVGFLDDPAMCALRLTRTKIRDLMPPLQPMAIITDLAADPAFVAAQQALDADFRERLQTQNRPERVKTAP